MEGSHTAVEPSIFYMGMPAHIRIPPVCCIDCPLAIATQLLILCTEIQAGYCRIYENKEGI